MCTAAMITTVIIYVFVVQMVSRRLGLVLLLPLRVLCPMASIKIQTQPRDPALYCHGP